MSQFLAHIGDVATSPYGLVAYLVVAVLWAFVLLRTSRLRSISRALALVPEHQRKSLLEKDYGYHLKKGMTADEFIRAQRTTYIFIAFLAVIAAMLIFALTALMQRSKAAADPRQIAMCDALNTIISGVGDGFASIKGAPSRSKGSAWDKVFESRVQIPESTYNYVQYEGDHPYFIATLYYGTDERIAVGSYERFIRDFASCTRDWIPHDGMMDKTQLVQSYKSFVKDNKKVIVALDGARTPPDIFVNVMAEAIH